MRKTNIERFMAKVRVAPNGCWTWTGALNKDGYGSFWDGTYRPSATASRGYIPRMVLAHRWSYEYHVGPLPDGLNACHHCDTPGCVNPGCLFAGTQRKNVHDCIAKGRHLVGNAKVLTDDQEADVRSLYRGEYGDIKRLCDRFGVSKIIARVVRDLPRQGRLAA